ncbi:hypothetical protein BGX30_005909 [Mortierella sp. GBA39]|nr:hypothetical protein BGX30_005909 [Mortierella sp. GBA39]
MVGLCVRSCSSTCRPSWLPLRSKDDGLITGSEFSIWSSEEFPGQMSRLTTEVDRYLQEYHCILGQWNRVGLYNVRYMHNSGDWYVWRNLF